MKPIHLQNLQNATKNGYNCARFSAGPFRTFILIILSQRMKKSYQNDKLKTKYILSRKIFKNKNKK